MATVPKIQDLDYIRFLVAAQAAFSCTEAARCCGERENTPAHDAFTRLLLRRPPDTGALYSDVEPHIDKTDGLLIVDDSTLDKPYSKNIDLVGWHWSGKHKATVLGINLITLLWTNGGARLPIDCRVYDKPQTGKDKNDYFQEMLTTAKERGLEPRFVGFDSWYSGLANLKFVRSKGWQWITQLKSNRQVDPDGSGNVPICDLEIPEEGRIVHLRGYGFIKVWRKVLDFDQAQHWATSDLSMTEPDRTELARQCFAIEEFHRGVKQCCAIERCQARSERAQKNHIIFAIRAFVRLEFKRLQTGISWYESKRAIVRGAVGMHMTAPS